MRKSPVAPGLDTLNFTAAPGCVTQTRRYKLITPLFGGGVVPGENDRDMLIRVASIRGQLRFWWRATRGGRFGNGRDSLRAMKDAEDLLWGAASKPKRPRPSQVQITVKIEQAGEVDHPYEVVESRANEYGETKPQVRERNGSKSPAYVAFPLQPNDKDENWDVGMDTKAVRVGIEFTLTITYPDRPATGVFPDGEAKEVEAALWAWETFGGIGGRTRRGFGALQRTDDDVEKPTNPNEVLACLNERLNHYGVNGTWPNGVPHLPTVFVSGTNFKTHGQGQSNSVWFKLIGKLRDFRQERNPGTTPNRPGRSRWTEPDEIRLLKPPAPLRHAAPIYAPRIQKFPRGAFGLPIIFHFVGAGEPKDTTLQGRNYERLASPLILRPLACVNNHQAVGLAVILEAPRLPPGGIILKDSLTNHVADTILDPAAESGRLTKADGTPLLKGKTDVLQAFLATL